MKNTLTALAAFIVLSLLSGCGLLIGSVKPVEQKNDDYRTLDLSRMDSDWKKIEKASDESATDIADVSYQSSRTASIISANSACRPAESGQKQDLRSFTHLLLLGISDVSQRDEKELTVDGVPALETTVKGKLNNESMMLKTVVAKKEDCVYDLMYIARPEHFSSQENYFAKFVQSARLK